MEQYTVTGMSCAACATRVEKAVSAVDGVESCSVSLLTNSMGVEGTFSPSDIVKAVENAGYGASPKGASRENKGMTSAEKLAEQEEALKDHETPVLKKRLISSAAVLLILMYFSMGHTMWQWPVPAFFEDNPVGLGILEMLLALVVMNINKKFFTSGIGSLIHGGPNMDTLVALGSGVSFAYSLVELFAMTGAQVRGDMDAVMSYAHNLYFESAAMIVTLITIGKMLEAMSKGKTTNALKSLMKMAPKTAVIVRDGKETEVAIDEVKIGDIFVVKPGENIPVDGVVVEGTSAVNEAALTGESIPVDKAEGDTVAAATINQSGYLRCRATRVGEDTTLSQIIQMVSDAAATKAPIARIADRVSGIFVPAVMAISAVVFVIWMVTGADLSFALSRAIAVLVISCPCALGLATPVAIMVGNGMGAKNGILFKTSAALEETGRVETVVLDKTGTITKGEPQVTDLIPAEGVTEEELLCYADLLEEKSEHPLAKAVTRRAEEMKKTAKEHGTEAATVSGAENERFAADDADKDEELTGFEALPGNGLRGTYHGSRLSGGNLRFIRTAADIPDEFQKRADQLAEQGKTPLYFAKDHRLLGIIAVADVMKEESPEAIRQLRNMGIEVVMLTGDNARTARAIGEQAGVDETIADVLPDGKESVIRLLKEKGGRKTAMVGDGINDAPALTRADIGIAIGAGADVAIDAADVVLSKSRLTDVPASIRLARGTLRNIHENLFWAFFYNVICIPLAAGAYYHAFGILLNPMIGAACMSLSSFCVVTNALRLNLLKIHDPGRDRARKSRAEKPALHAILEELENQNRIRKEREESEMTKTMNIKGMMCEHCEATVKKALEKIDGVSSAEVSHEKGTAVVTMTEDVDDAVLKQAVEDKDYEVESISA
ncbi:MAG: heavy metal translocating P-type ATPase [Bilifractor sp.]|jgi:Cu2+-exporting ATPase